MKYLRKEEDIVLELKPDFQRKLFEEIIRKHGRYFISKELKKSPAALYFYKNNRIKVIPKVILQKAIKLSSLSEKDLVENTIKTFSAKEARRKILDLGIRKRTENLRRDLSITSDSFSLLKNNEESSYLNVKEWLEKNSWLEKIGKQRGIINNISSEENKEDIKILYNVFNKRTKRFENYSVSIPVILNLDKDFYYFLGLIYGDGLSGARIGLANKDKSLLYWTANFIKSKFPKNKLQTQIIFSSKINEEELKSQSTWLKKISPNFESILNKGSSGGYVMNVFITHNILRRIIDGFLNNLEGLFEKSDFLLKGSFLAGFFDAEGNVNKRDRNLRFSQKIEEKVKIMIRLLEREGYHTRYDKSNILIGYKKLFKSDLDLFKKQIFPFLKHSIKTKEAEELLRGYFVRKEYKPILEIIKNNKQITHRKIAKFIGKTKCSEELRALVEAGLLNRFGRVGESFKYEINPEGLRYLEEK